ncbi:MAG: class I SAM-dependent methyltransferase [Ktedonobacteraceae bacterium]|nr:class I SAM-dependent methyltransferase [Ktedonobacteraceae bacterium]
MKLTDRFSKLVDKNQARPAGIIGRLVGARMAYQHRPETNWTISLLEIKPTDSILEIGFGNGRAIELMSAQASGGHIAGIDLSHAMLHAASHRNARAIKAGLVELKYGDVAALPFQDQQFDKLLSIHSLYFWPERADIMNELARVLKPGGMLALTLSPGKVNMPTEAFYNTMVEEQILPAMQRLGFSSSYVKQGPNSRQYRSVAVVGVK